MSTTVKQPITKEQLFELYKVMLLARETDLIEQSYAARGEAFFHVSGAGHEASVAIAPHLRDEDFLHCHYRDKALMLARGIPPYMFFLSLFNKDGSHSRGRQMNAHMSSKEHNILSLTGPVGNNVLQAVGVAEVLKQNGSGIVLCSVGEGTTQESEVLEGLVYAATESLPILFLIHDNSYAISTKTDKKTFYANGSTEFSSIPIHSVDGRSCIDSFAAFERIVTTCRSQSSPHIAVLSVERLHSHTNADDQTVYRTKTNIDTIQKHDDPLIRTYASLLEFGYTADELETLQQETYKELQKLSKKAQLSQEPTPQQVLFRDIPPELLPNAKEYIGNPEKKELTMIEAMNKTLDYHLEHNPNVSLFGEDLEDPKGDVFGVTKGLSTKYGTHRVTNSPLNEALIVGASIGRALAGGHPVAFLQFADFLPIAFNQLFTELGSMYWRTDGSWQAPVIVMISSGGYRPGLGPFHASSMESIASHIPGIDICMPATAYDAVGMLNAAFASKRPTLFFYPKNQLNNKDIATSRDVKDHIIPLGRSRTVQTGTDISFIAYGNTVSLCSKAAGELAKHGITSDVIDLRYIAPWDKEQVLNSAKKTGRVIIVHEDSLTTGFGAEIAATIAEKHKDTTIRRVTRADTYVPCHFPSQLAVLPSYKRILEEAVELFDGEIHWEKEEEISENIFIIEAIGSSPSDESITVINWLIQEGSSIEEGQLIAELEADKATVELKSPIEGMVEKLCSEEGDTLHIGDPLVHVRLDSGKEMHQKPITRENPGTPIITITKSAPVLTSHAPVHHLDPQILAIYGTTGSRKVSNEEIVKDLSEEWDNEAIIRRSGIETRYWIQGDETALSMALDVTREALDSTGLSLHDMDGIICSTGTPIYHTPSMATLIHAELSKELEDDYFGFSYDISAACSGYIYALQAAYNHLTHNPTGTVLLITTEALSPHLDKTDKSTAPIFGDAATATIISGGHANKQGIISVKRPILSAFGDPNGDLLKVPGTNTGESISMDGGKVYQTAIKNMMRVLQETCKKENVSLEDLDLIVPHQANQRIIDAIQVRLKIPKEKIYSNVKHFGNTSSNTIPLCLRDLLDAKISNKKVALVAFGGGFTFGSTIAHIR